MSPGHSNPDSKRSKVESDRAELGRTQKPIDPDAVRKNFYHNLGLAKANRKIIYRAEDTEAVADNIEIKMND